MTEIFQEKQDFGRLIDELNAAGYSTYWIAQRLGRNWDTVNGWRKHEPKHSDGEALMALHQGVLRKASSV